MLSNDKQQELLVPYASNRNKTLLRMVILIANIDIVNVKGRSLQVTAKNDANV